MGSFNETCVLSGLNIPWGTPVRLLFLTQNPYVRSDQREAQRGCYHTDQWFVRTPPLKGKYDDYGRAALKPSPLQKLIADAFSADVVERPFGFNQYHTHPVFRGKDLSHYLAAAWEGRLLVQDDYTRPRTEAPESWPTWKRVFKVLEEAKLPLQHDEDKGGYNAQHVIPGVVVVDYNSYGDTSKYLQKAEEVLSPLYDCKVLKKFEDRPDYDLCLIVTAKGAFENPSLLAEVDKIKSALTTHPELYQRYRELPVLAVMAREDVWKAFCTVPIPTSYFDRGVKPTVKGLRQKLEQAYNKNQKAHERLKSKDANLTEIWDDLDDFRFKDVMFSLPFQTTAGSHLSMAAKSPDFTAHDELLDACAELSRVETVLSRTHRAWYIPPLGGQESEWKLQTQLLSKLHAISKKQQIGEENDD